MWTMRSWVRSVVLVVLSAALVGAFAVPALGQSPEPPPPRPETLQETVERLRAELADRLEQMRAAREQPPEERRNRLDLLAWLVESSVYDLIEWVDPEEKEEARRTEKEAIQAEQQAADEANQAGQPDADHQPDETAAPEPQPEPTDENRADLGLWSQPSGDTDDQDGTIWTSPGGVVDGRPEITTREPIGGAVGGEAGDQGDSDLFSELFNPTTGLDLGPGILITPKPDLDLGPGILVTPKPELDLGAYIFTTPDVDPGQEILLPPELDLRPEILLPPRDLPGVTDRSDLAPA